jgi:aspartyl-tRNA(Asn)/glutamyl-tRNA(Gln) amidotransferase subunit A
MIVGMLMSALREEMIMDHDRRTFLRSAAGIGAATIATKLAAPTPSGAQPITDNLSELNRLTASDLASLIALRKVSPVEAVDAALARLEATQPILNAFVAIDADGARRTAQAAEAAVMRGDNIGPLHGVPVSVKDTIDVGGLPASYGSLTMKGNIARADAPSVARLRQAGAIILGKTATPEFGWTGITKSLVHGTTRNPWNTALTPGGSSGGAVASVAAGVTAIAIGTDGGGSVRAPSSLTGLVGIKANFARVPVWPVSAVMMLAHVGPIARNVEDAALVLKVIAGPDRRDPFSLMAPIGPEPEPDAVRGLRVAFSPTLGFAKVEPPVGQVVAGAIERLRSVFPSLETVTDVCPDVGDIHRALFLGAISARLGDLVTTSPELIDPLLLTAIKRFRQMDADTYTRLQRKQFEVREVLRQFFERYDLLLTPTTPCVAWDVEQLVPPGLDGTVPFTRPFNHTGQPAASVPCGRTPANLPVGLQIVAPLGGEATLIAALRIVERTLGAGLAGPLEITKA